MLETTESTKHLLGDIDVLHWWTNSYLRGMSTWLPPQNWDVLDGLRNIPLLNSNRMSLPGSSRENWHERKRLVPFRDQAFQLPVTQRFKKTSDLLRIYERDASDSGRKCMWCEASTVGGYSQMVSGTLGVSELISLTGSSWWICARLTDVRISDGFQHIWPWLPISSEQTALGMCRQLKHMGFLQGKVENYIIIIIIIIIIIYIYICTNHKSSIINRHKSMASSSISCSKNWFPLAGCTWTSPWNWIN